LLFGGGQDFDRARRLKSERNERTNVCGDLSNNPVNENFQWSFKPTSERFYPAPLWLRYDYLKGECDI